MCRGSTRPTAAAVVDLRRAFAPKGRVHGGNSQFTSGVEFARRVEQRCSSRTHGKALRMARDVRFLRALWRPQRETVADPVA